MSHANQLTILHQDDHLIAVDKPAGQLVHPSDTPQESDLVTMKLLRDQLGQQVQAVHRLDRPTSGVLLFALDPKTAQALHQAFEKHEVQKNYWAIIDGHPSKLNWICREPIQKNDNSPFRTAETEFRTLQHLPHDLTLIEAFPKTGRFHQIRRHLLHIGHPIVGDYRYAGIKRSTELCKNLNIGTRMLLQSKSLTLQHPILKTHLTITAPPDPMIEALMNLKVAR
jgi:tRNA pseudouridine65 synthase